MIDARDPATVSMPLDVKRGRGRPRKPGALTPAERAKRYRERHAVVSLDRWAELDASAAKGRDALVDEVAQLRKEVGLLVEERSAAYREIERLTLKLSDRRRDVTNNDLFEAQLSAQHWQGEADLWRRAAAQLAEEGSRLIPLCGPVRRAVAEELLRSLRFMSHYGKDVAEKGLL